MVTISKKWNVKTTPNESKISELMSETGYSTFFIQLCLQRGLDTKERVESFLHPDENWFHDPFMMHDMEKAQNRMIQAIEQGEMITIYGDYDADGVTSTSIMIETLSILGAQVNYYIPNRFTDGYGPNVDVFKKLIEAGTQLIVTVDNGVAGHEAISSANEMGVDVIVTDHHELPEDLPDAYAIVHPNHPKGEYPFSDLSGAGVALKLAHALLDEFPFEFLELAAIGTIADLVSLTDENRAICKFGIESLKQTQRLGIQQLLQELNTSFSEVDETTIGFKIGPVLNALGRLESADKAVELLTTFDIDAAKELARYLVEKNEERKELVQTITDEALEMLEQEDFTGNIIILQNENWHEGVLGIVASRIVKERGKPAIILKTNPETGISKGSARSIEAFNLFKACNEARELFTAFGGHHMAAGMSLPTENVSELQRMLDEKAEKIKKTTSFAPEIEVDLAIEVEDVSIEAISEVNLLSPFGTDNPFPKVSLKDVKGQQIKKIGADKNHLKMLVSDNQSTLDTIGFQYGNFADVLSEQSRISLVGTLNINEWNGFKKPQLMLEDIFVDGPVVTDKRSSQLTQQMLDLKSSHFVCFQEKVYNSIKDKIDETSTIQLINDNQEEMQHNEKQIVYVDCPPNLELFKEFFVSSADVKTVIYFYSYENLYLKGLPAREQFGDLYKFIAAHQNIPVDEIDTKLAKHLKINKVLLNFMIKVFLEAGFVRISDGVLNKVKQPKKVNLTETKTYNKYKEQLEAEEILIYSSFDELMSLLTQWTESA